VYIIDDKKPSIVDASPKKLQVVIGVVVPGVEGAVANPKVNPEFAH
jgi:hypothetical protein